MGAGPGTEAEAEAEREGERKGERTRDGLMGPARREREEVQLPKGVHHALPPPPHERR